MKTFRQHITEEAESEKQRRIAYVRGLQLKLTDADLTPDQLKDFAKRSNGIASSPNQISAKLDLQAMKPNHLNQVIAQPRVNPLMKQVARNRLKDPHKDWVVLPDYVSEGVARKDHADGEFHTLKAPNNRTLVFVNSEMVGHVDLMLGTPDVIKNSKDQYVTYLNASYRDSRLKIRRPVFRRIGTFDTLDAALAGLKKELKNLTR